MVRTRLNIGCRYSTPVRERPLHPTRGHFTPEPSQTQAPVTPATEPERRAGGSLTTLYGSVHVCIRLRSDRASRYCQRPLRRGEELGSAIVDGGVRRSYGCGHRASSERVEHIEQRLVGLDADVTGRWAAFALAVESDARCPGQGVGEARLLLRPLRRRLQHLSAVPGRGRAGHGRRVRRPRPAAQADGERGQERGGPPRGAGLPGLQLYRRANAQAAHRAATPHCSPGPPDHIVLFSRVSPVQVLFRVVPQSTPRGVTRQILGMLAPVPYVIICIDERPRRASILI